MYRIWRQQTRSHLLYLCYETGQTILFWDILWQKNFVCMNCDIFLALEHDPQALRNLKYINPILRNCNSKEAGLKHFCLIFEGKYEKLPKNASILLPENCNFSR